MQEELGDIPLADAVMDPGTPWHVRMKNGRPWNMWTNKPLSPKEKAALEAGTLTPPVLDAKGEEQRKKMEERLQPLLTPAQQEQLVKDKKERLKPVQHPEDQYKPSRTIPPESPYKAADMPVRPDGGLENIMAVFKMARPDEIDYWRHWYTYAGEDAEGLSSKFEAPRNLSAALIALLSPNTKWEENVFAAEQMLRGQGKKVIDYRKKLDEEAAENEAAKIFPSLFVQREALGVGSYLQNITKAQRLIDTWTKNGKPDTFPIDVGLPRREEWDPRDEASVASARGIHAMLTGRGWTAAYMAQGYLKEPAFPDVWATFKALPQGKRRPAYEAAMKKKRVPPEQWYEPEKMRRGWQPGVPMPYFDERVGAVIFTPPFKLEAPKAGESRSAPKVTAFYWSIVEPEKHQDEVVLDGHAINIWRGKPKPLSTLGDAQPGKELREVMIGDYKAAAAQATQLLQSRGVSLDEPITPQQMQAITWSVWRNAVEEERKASPTGDTDDSSEEGVDVEAALGDIDVERSAARPRAIPSDTGRVWYHGDTAHRITFADQKFQNEENWNAMGPGIYFTSSKEQALGYAGQAGWVYTASFTGKLATDKQRAKVTEIRKFLAMLDDEGRSYLFSNWDPDPRAAQQAVERAYTQMDVVSCFADLGRQGGTDYGTTGREWCALMAKLGYAGMLHKLPGVEHLVVWDPSGLTILAEEPATALCAEPALGDDSVGDIDVEAALHEAQVDPPPAGFSADDFFDEEEMEPEAPGTALQPELKVGETFKVGRTGPTWEVIRTLGTSLHFVKRVDQVRKWFGAEHNRVTGSIGIYPIAQGSGDRTGPPFSFGTLTLVPKDAPAAEPELDEAPPTPSSAHDAALRAEAWRHVVAAVIGDLIPKAQYMLREPIVTAFGHSVPAGELTYEGIHVPSDDDFQNLEDLGSPNGGPPQDNLRIRFVTADGELAIFSPFDLEQLDEEPLSGFDFDIDGPEGEEGAVADYLVPPPRKRPRRAPPPVGPDSPSDDPDVADYNTVVTPSPLHDDLRGTELRQVHAPMLPGERTNADPFAKTKRMSPPRRAPARMAAEQPRDDESGRFVSEEEEGKGACTCGHAFGSHTGEPPYPCTHDAGETESCDCGRYEASKAQRSAGQAQRSAGQLYQAVLVFEAGGDHLEWEGHADGAELARTARVFRVKASQLTEGALGWVSFYGPPIVGPEGTGRHVLRVRAGSHALRVAARIIEG